MSSMSESFSVNDVPVCRVSTNVLHEWVIFSLRCPSLSGKYKCPPWVSHFQFTMSQSVRWVQMSSMSESFSVYDVPVCQVSTNVLHEWVLFSYDVPVRWVQMSSMSESSLVTISQSVRWVQMSSMSESFSVMMSQSVRWVQMSSMSKPLDIVYTSIYL
jgi:hypothetical protein